MFIFPKNKTTSRRGISQILGSLFMLAIVVPVGIVILSQGLYEVADFSRFLSITKDHGINSVQEDIIFEHVRFEPTGNQVTVSIRNISTITSSIDKISIVKMDTQELLVYQDNLASSLPLKDGTDIIVNANLASSGQWADSMYVDSDYKISITTIRGNFFDTIARPFNT
ncbi:MAG: hypothetical protein IIA81_00015 [Thaumarchaeota archaeon]|nr:hypothetical protein [Nitrososphaerota archaeon]